MQTALISQTPTFIQRGKKKEKQQKKKRLDFLSYLLLVALFCCLPIDVALPEMLGNAFQTRRLFFLFTMKILLNF